jgi:hypothetical protein
MEGFVNTPPQRLAELASFYKNDKLELASFCKNGGESSAAPVKSPCCGKNAAPVLCAA